MKRLVSGLAVVALVILPRSAAALQLSWSSGSTNLTFTEATRCTLVVQAEEGAHLPADWTLTWLATDCEIRPVPVSGPCSPDMAEVASVTNPTTAADILSRASTVRFCSAATEVPSMARWIFDLEAGCSGKFKVCALDPTDPDSTRVSESGEVTFNGGIDGAFPPVVLHTSTEHHSTEFLLSAVGSNLTEAQSLQLAAPDGSWEVPLEITSASDNSVVARAGLAANVPAAMVLASGEAGAGAALVEEDPAPPPFEPESAPCSRIFIEDVLPPYTIQAKDFAFVPGGWTPSGSWKFHLFYIRHNQLPGLSPDSLEKNLGHAVSDSLNRWTVLDTAAVKVRAGRFDSQHVWAPTIVRKGLTYYMLYAGVDDNSDQRIGFATSNDLITWTQSDSVLSANQIPWADPHPVALGGKTQLRDPYVMEDPAVPGSWLMYYVTVASQYSPDMVVGVAKSSNLLTWTNHAPLWKTLFTAGSGKVESPHMFQRNGKWWLFSSVNTKSVAPTDPNVFDTVYAVSNANANAPTDTLTGNWTSRRALQFLVPGSEGTAYNFWHATEQLSIGNVQYLAAFNDAQVGISYTRMEDPMNPAYLFTGDCPTTVSVEDPVAGVQVPRLQLLGARPARQSVGFRVELPTKTTGSLAIYNVLGRRIRTLLKGDIAAGVTSLTWDGRDENGANVPSGVYFGSLAIQGTRLSQRVLLIH